ncbi:MAG: beta-lactamase family protein [Flavobacteriales bacterium]|nr:beta-lactamase family protein [Flavobacteriales bacterium]
MKKKIVRGILLFLVIGLILGYNYISKALPIANGYAAKTVCSCLFLSNRNLDDIKSQELSKLSYVNIEVNQAEKFVESDAFGFYKRKAIYRDGLGCTLLYDGSFEEVEPPNRTSNGLDTIPWPYGSRMDSAYASFDNIDMELLKLAIDNNFNETDLNNKKRTRAVLVIHKDKIVSERYGEGFNKNTRQTGWSMTKSIVNALIGITVKEQNLNIKEEIGRKYWNDERSSITWDHLLRMSSGLDFEEEYGKPSDATNMLFNSQGAYSVAIKSKLGAQPDDVWYYSSGTTNLLSKFLADTLQSLGLDHVNQPYAKLFDKLGMSSAVMELDVTGNFVGSSFCFATARDWAKFGLLYLKDGWWNGEQILPDNWVEYSKTPTPKSDKGQYGAQFWLNAGLEKDGNDRRWPNLPRDIFFASGFEGQKIFIIPSYDLVIVRLGQYDSRTAWDYGVFLTDILKAFQQPAQ